MTPMTPMTTAFQLKYTCYTYINKNNINVVTVYSYHKKDVTTLRGILEAEVFGSND